MPETMNVYGRPSIHKPQSPHGGEASDTVVLPGANESQESQESQESYHQSGSDVSDIDDADDDGNNVSNVPQKLRNERYNSVSRSPSRSNLKQQLPHSSTFYTPESYNNSTAEESSSSSASISSPKLIFVFAVLVAIPAVYVLANSSFQRTDVKICSFDKLQQQYAEQKTEMWLSLKIGIENILNERDDKPGVYLFVHHGQERAYQLVVDIAKHSSSCFGESKKLVEMKNEDFTSDATIKDYGIAIDKYKLKIKEGNVILIANLNEIPPEAALAFHAICDTHSPIAKDVVIFLTLRIPNAADGNVQLITENTLNKLWGSKLKDNELEPLITRVTDQVIGLQN